VQTSRGVAFDPQQALEEQAVGILALGGQQQESVQLGADDDIPTVARHGRNKTSALQTHIAVHTQINHGNVQRLFLEKIHLPARQRVREHATEDLRQAGGMQA